MLSPLLSVESSLEGAPPEVSSLPVDKCGLCTAHTSSVYFHFTVFAGVAGSTAVFVLFHDLVAQHQQSNSDLQGELHPLYSSVFNLCECSDIEMRC